MAAGLFTTDLQRGPQMLEPFAPDLWIVDGPTIVAAAGFHYPSRMAIVRLAKGDLWVWSPVALTDALKEAVEALGPVRFLVAPNSLHHIYLQDWAAVFPEAEIHAAPGLARKRKDLDFTATLSNNSPWPGEIEVLLFEGNLITTEAVFFHKASETVLFTDLLQQLPKDWFKGWRRWIARSDLMLEDEPAVPKKFRRAFLRKKKARAAARILFGWPAERVIMAHGTPVREEGAAFLRRAFNWLIAE